MNSRELLQERRILANGDTVWEDSVLIDCAKTGRICILDGIERIHWSALEVFLFAFILFLVFLWYRVQRNFFGYMFSFSC